MEAAGESVSCANSTTVRFHAIARPSGSPDSVLPQVTSVEIVRKQEAAVVFISKPSRENSCGHCLDLRPQPFDSLGAPRAAGDHSWQVGKEVSANSEASGACIGLYFL